MSSDAACQYAIVGMACRLPGARDVQEFERLLFGSQSALGELPPDRLDRDLYFDKKKGVPGKTYTLLGGYVPESPVDADVRGAETHDPSHRLFCETALRAWKSAGFSSQGAEASRAGLYVGHSGGTKLGGPLSLASQIEESLDFLNDIEGFHGLAASARRSAIQKLVDAVRQTRPRRTSGDSCSFEAYQAASLAAATIGIGGPRQIVDAACASSLMALNQAILALDAGRIDAAVVGGSTYNNVDNLILFSQSQACTSEGSRPFDNDGSGLVSSEGYVAVVVLRHEDAVARNLPILAVLKGLGISSDGRGKSLWAPRREGQELAIRRAYGNSAPLQVEYLEAHATSTQLGDATELESLSNLRRAAGASSPLSIGSVKSNIGHTLEAAGLVGLVKLILAMRRKEIPESINYCNPTTRFDWSTGDVQVIGRRTPWNSHGDPRRAGVNAFGIGGLNAHAFIEEPTSPPAVARRTNPDAQKPIAEPIAVVGRGLVLPGASSVAGFFELLKSGRTSIIDPPAERWRSGVSPKYRGGFITDYKFAAEKYRIPPKQVRQANPLQWMLLDSVTQAVEECDHGKWNFDRTRMGVVVGTAFGGEFSNQLQTGLRLPEICRELQKALVREGLPRSEAQQVADQFRSIYLQNRPALLDETGSFTASTLASRIAKAFDLMGGACAIDADDLSGVAAISLAADLLRSGQCDSVIVGAASRTLDLVGFEHLIARDRLVQSGRPEDVPNDLSKIIPGEGAAVLILRRRADAERDAQPILGIIDGISSGPANGVSITRVQSDDESRDAELVRKVGYVAAAHGLVRLIEEMGANAAKGSHNTDGEWRTLSVRSTAPDNFEMNASVQVRGPSRNRTVTRTAKTTMTPPTPIRSVVSTPGGSSRRIVRLSAPNESQFRSLLTSSQEDPAGALRSGGFNPADPWRAAILADTPESLAKSLRAALTRFDRGQRRFVIDDAGAIIWQRLNARPRIAWMFPGQGSQYHDRPVVLNGSVTAQAVLERFEAASVATDKPSIKALFNDATRGASDLWSTQAWMLAMSTGYAEHLRGMGHRPDVVIGHSFGEFAAALAAGVIDVEQALRIAGNRADSVAACCREDGVLLSVRGRPSEVQAVLRQRELAATVTHHNSPRQTVIACRSVDQKPIQAALTDAGLASLKIPVGAAFHTPFMQEAEQVFERSVADVPLRPPTSGFLSATTVQYLAEGGDIRRSLVTQLTRPVLYEPTVRRALRDGCELLIEVGPNDVLTRLNREIVDDAALCLSLDIPGKPWTERLALVEAAIECVTGLGAGLPMALARLASVASRSVDDVSDVEIIDVRNRARRSQQTVEITAAPIEQPPVVAPPTPEPAKAPAPIQSPARVAATSAAVHQFLVNLVVDLTGYSPDVVDMDADLEADIGLDSIKKAQIIGELSEWADLGLAPTEIRLGAISTLRQIAALVSGSISAEEHLADQLIEQIVEQDEVNSIPAESWSRQAAMPSADASKIEELLIDFVIDQTGFSRDVIDLDADLEAELGVDSIKRAQLLGEMHEQFNLTGINLERTSLNQFPTLASIRDFLLRELTARGDGQPERKSTPTPTAPPKAPTIAPNHAIPTAETPVTRKPVEQQPAVIGVDPVDEIPTQWAALFDPGAPTGSAEKDCESARQLGAKHRNEIRSALRELITREQSVAVAEPDEISPTTAALAAGAGVSPGAVRAAQRLFKVEPKHKVAKKTAESVPTRTRRFVLRTIDAPRRANAPAEFQLNGPVLIVGHNPIAAAIIAKVRSQGGQAVQLDAVSTLDSVDSQLEAIWKKHGLTPHLFLTTPHDIDALRHIDREQWETRRVAGIQIPYRVSQLWMGRMIAASRMNEGSVIAIGNLGGDFGFSGRQVESPEGGGIGALTKAMVIESWMAGFRGTPMKVVDVAPTTSAKDAVDGIWRELAVPSYDLEVEVSGEERRTVQAVEAALDEATRSRTLPRGTWVLTGGGRGITAVTGMALAKEYGLTLQMLGTAAVPEVTAEMRARGKADRSQLRREVMQQASERGENAIQTWRDTEKALEIDETLEACRAQGIAADYYSCDVSDPDDVAAALELIREKHGPIRGVIHGAGAGQDARFDRKRPDKVDQCIRAKVDGALTLMAATKDDPLDWFVGFGSISGRFGANGHTDYSLANDMLAKIVDLYRRERPEVASLTFHWHAWGDIGMATKPEAKLALEMIGMEFMPASEGIEHFLREFAHGGDESEVLITDHQYYRKFFPADRIADQASSDDSKQLPLLRQSPSEKTAKGEWTVHLDPVRDLFLSQHTVNGRPTLPFVVAIELMAEGARLAAGGGKVAVCRNVEAIRALKFAKDAGGDVTIAAESIPTGQDGPAAMIVRCALKADLQQRNGRILEAGREHFRGEFLIGDSIPKESKPWPELTGLHWRAIEYQGPDAPVYHGPELRSLQKFAAQGRTSYGQIGASAPVQLFGGDRAGRGWTLSCDPLDACLYACALHAWSRVQKLSLPVRFGEIVIGRLPDPGEPCLVRIDEQSHDDAGMDFAFTLFGQNGDVLVSVSGYRAAWLQR